jgi:indole-3-acetate monooxygenase
LSILSLEKKIVPNDLLDTIKEYSQENEKNGNIAEKVISKMKQLNLFSILLPTSIKHHNISLKDFFMTVENISYMDTSTGWCYMINTILTGAAGSFLPSSGIDTVFGNKNESVIIAGQTAPRADIKRDGDKYTISGHFKFGSGVQHANWLACGFLHPDSNEHYLAIFKKQKFKIKNSWNAFGMAATGSHDYILDETVLDMDLIFPHNSHSPLREKSHYQYGLVAITALGHTAVATGHAKRALEETAQIIRSNNARTLSDLNNFYSDYSRANAKIRSINAYISDILNTISSENIDKNQIPTIIDNIRLASVYISEECSNIITFCFNTCGIIATDRNNVIGRIFRESSVIKQHIMINVNLYKTLGEQIHNRNKRK